MRLDCASEEFPNNNARICTRTSFPRSRPLPLSGSQRSGPVVTCSMDYCTPQSARRHNPVDSIQRKLQTIQRHSERESNSPFQIPKFSSSSYDSPQSGLRHNLEAILKKRTVHDIDGERGRGRGRGTGMLTATDYRRNSLDSSVPPSTPSDPFTPTPNRPTAANITYTITSTLGERRDAGGTGQGKAWQRYCSTPAGQTKDSSRFTFARGSQFTQPDVERQGGSPPLPRARSQSHGILSYNLNFCSTDSGNPLECELPYPALVVKRLSMGEGGSTMTSESRKETLAEVSLICEEDLLDTIFHVCDTQRRGKVYVSRIVDYLRHTTSRSSEDSGLEDLCNMLDPEHKDVSIDLDTYHAIMKEWIEDCRNNGDEDTADDLTQDSVKLRDSLSAKRSMLLNMTSGSLEAFGGDASRADLETSELVYCVADLQMSNHKLQEEVRRLKQVVEGMEDGNQKLAEENEELRNQARSSQQLALKEKLLKEEVEEMKMTLSFTEESRARASAHSKNMERENQNLIAKIASLQEENFKVTMETDELQRRLRELCDINADLQVQIHSFDAAMSEKENVILEKSRQMEELKAVVEEYSAVTELLRADKTKLENQMQMFHPDMDGPGVSLSVAYRLNQTISGSLQTELALAQSPLEGVNRLSSTMTFASSLDETLDREVLLLLQGPSPEHMALEFKSLLNKLKSDFREEVGSVLSTVRGLMDDHGQPEASADPSLQTVRAELDARRADWALGLDQLARYTDSLEKELIKMASNMRRSRTEILHLSVRVQEQENQKRQLCEELEQLKTPQDSREASCQTPDPEQEPGEDLDWDEEFALQDFLRSELAERNRRAPDGRTDNGLSERRGGEEEARERWTPVDAGGEGEARETSTPLPARPAAVQPGQGPDSVTYRDSEPEANCQPLQEEAEEVLIAHSQPVCVGYQVKDARSDPTHSENNNVENLQTAESLPASARNLSSSPEQDRTVTPGNTPPRLAKMVPPNSTSPGPDETITQNGSPRPTSEDHRGGGERGGEANTPTSDMSFAKSLSQDQLAGRAAAEDSTSLLPVLLEEEEGVQDPPPVVVSMAGTDRIADSSSPQSVTGSTVTRTNQSRAGVEGPSQSADSALGAPSGKNKKELELSRAMEAIEEHKAHEDPREAGVTTAKQETSIISDTNDSFREDPSSQQSDKEIETEFQRLSLGFKCDMFTLEKRLRLEERSRDLAEENVRKEVSSCQGLLQALIPLCEEDNQSMEIIHRLQKNLDILIQSMTRVSSRSEMLGAIHQESRIGKAVEVMIQHVENLRRMYTKEHTELLELRETLTQNERSFGSQTEKDDFRGKKQPASQYYKTSTRRVSIAAIPRSGGSNMHFDMPKDGSDAEMERLTRRSPWNVPGKSMVRPPLKRFVSSGAWVDAEDPSLMMKGMAYESDSQSEDDRREEPLIQRRKSSLSELGNMLTSLILPLKTRQDELFVMLPSPSPSPTSPDPMTGPALSHSYSASARPSTAVVARGSRGVWLWLAIVVVLAGLLALLAGLVMQPAVDAAPVGTGDSWMTIQQLLWPYTGLRHNGQPPV